MTEWEQVPAHVLRHGDTVKRTKNAAKSTLTTDAEEVQTRVGVRVAVRSADWHVTSSPDAIWWREVRT